MVPIPINDHIRRRIFWGVTLLLIVANVLAFLFELSLGYQLNRFVFYFAIIPARYTGPHPGVSPEGFLVPVFASMFLHAGWLHLLGNMLFLFVFGRSIEDRYGHVKFLLIYFLCGLAAAVTHIYFNAGSRVPTIGASGAIAGILGAYFVCFPAARITTLIPFIVFFILGYWFVLQFLSGLDPTNMAGTQGGVAVWAHVGGFIAGMVLAFAFTPRQPRMELLRPV
jgi:membrane associated rhomboid family serine protease